MEHIDYYSEKKWCGQCSRYVRYLMSVQHSFCADCGGKVGLFSKEDWQEVQRGRREEELGLGAP